jgi:hypothetical protein
VTDRSLRLVLWLGGLAGASLLAGCGSSASGAKAAATDFYDAVDASDSAAACALLAPATLRELEQTEHAACEEALLRVQLPEIGAIKQTERFGRQAAVYFDGDTAFLAEYRDGWRVVAVGCEPRDGLPYDCVVKGG